jgi:hypothetical protein
MNRSLRNRFGAATALVVTLTLTLPLIGGLPAQASGTPFVQGAGDAVAETLAVSPALSGEDLGVESGVSIADYMGTEGQAQSQVLTSALIGDLSVPIPASLGGIVAESSGTPTNQTSTLDGANGDGAGVLAVSASQSAGTATTTLGAFNLPGVLTVSGAQSSASTSIVKGETRVATATSDIGSVSLLGGLVVLNGLHWSATQSTGATAAQSGSFSVGSLSLAGKTVAVPVGGLSGAVALINAGLAETGLRLSLPTEQVGSDGSVQESALTIGLDKSALGKEVVSPFVPTLQPLRTLLNTTLVKIDPTLGESDLVLEIVLSILAGEGTLDIGLGGAYATTNGTAYGNPLDASTAAAPLGTSTSSALDGASSAPSLPVPVFNPSTTPPLITTPTTSAPAAPVGQPTKLSVRRLSSSSSCQSTSGGSCSTPRSTVVLIALVALTSVLLTFETLRMRRRKRLLLPEDA